MTGGVVWTFHLSPGIASSIPIPITVGIGATCPLLELSRRCEGLPDAAGVNRSLRRRVLGGAAAGRGLAKPHAWTVCEVVVGLVETRLGETVVAGGRQHGIAECVVVSAVVNIAELG